MKQKINLELDSKQRQLIFAGCLYILKDDEAFASLKQLMQANFKIIATTEETPTIQLNPHSYTQYSLQPLTGTTDFIDFHLRPLDKCLTAQLLWFQTQENKVNIWSFFEQFQTLAEKVKETASLLGSSLIFLTDDHDGQLMSELQSKFKLGRDNLMTTADGGLHFFPFRHERKHLYLLERKNGQSWHDPLTSEFVSLDWAFHKLQREKAYFNDRVRTVNRERLATDQQLSDILYNKISAASREENKTTFLEQQLAELAKMYSLTASNLHLTREAVQVVRGDVQNLGQSAEKLGESNQASFPLNHIRSYQNWLAEIIQQENDLKISLKNIKAAIDLVGSQVELLRGQEAVALQAQTKELLNHNLTLQEERFALQSAAELVELVVVFYYVLKSWEAVAAENLVGHLPPLLKFFPVALFSGSVVALTHYLAESRYHKHTSTRLKLVLSFVFLLIALLLMVLLPAINK